MRYDHRCSCNHEQWGKPPWNLRRQEVSGSINTNVGAMVALRNLQNTNKDLSATQKRISTGLNVADAYDDGASYAVAQGLRSDISALGAVNERLAVGKGMIDVAVKAGESISETMGSLRNVLLK